MIFERPENKITLFLFSPSVCLSGLYFSATSGMGSHFPNQKLNPVKMLNPKREPPETPLGLGLDQRSLSGLLPMMYSSLQWCYPQESTSSGFQLSSAFLVFSLAKRLRRWRNNEVSGRPSLSLHLFCRLSYPAELQCLFCANPQGCAEAHAIAGG